MDVVGDFMFSLLDDDVEPDAEIGGHHVHQTEIGDDFVLPD